MNLGCHSKISFRIVLYCIAITCIATVLLAGCATVPMTCNLPTHPSPDLPEHGISAHRGGILGCPENTIGTFQRAICHGVHQIELDVRMTLDEKLVVAHDDHVVPHGGPPLDISESTLTEVKHVKLKPCSGEQTLEYIPTLTEALAIMPWNVWINIDVKENSSRVGELVAEVVAKADRFDQVIFSARHNAAKAIRRITREKGTDPWIGNMDRKIFRSHYIDSTLAACDEFIQLTRLRGRPSRQTLNQLHQSGVRVNYSWLNQDKEKKLRRELQKLFNLGVDFVLVDHPNPAMRAACDVGIRPTVPQWNGPAPFHCPQTFHCNLDPSS